MKVKQCYLFVLLFMFVIVTNAIEVKAMNTGFTTEELTENDKKTFVSNVNISLLMVEPAKKGIQCFDVNEEGMVAIGQKGAHGKELCIYSADGTFLYGYTFNCAQSFGVEWDSECINIYFVRSDVVISVDSDGNILDIKEVQNTIENNTYENYLLYSTSRAIGDTRYLIRNDMGIFNWFALSYSQLITINTNGEESIIYDVSSAQFSNMVAVFVGVLVFACLVLAVVILQFNKLKRGT